MELWKNRLLPLLLVLACCGLVVYGTTEAIAEDEEIEDVENEDDFDDEEEWEDDEEWGMEEAMFEIEIVNQHLEMYRGLIDIVGQMTEVTQDSTATSLMALTTAKDLADDPEILAPFLETELANVQDKAVRRAIHLQLAEAYAEMDMPDKAKAHLSILIRGKE